MKSQYRPPSARHAFFAFSASFLFLSMIFVFARYCDGSPLCAWMNDQAGAGHSEFTQLQIPYDSRIFLRPLQHILQAFLYLIPFFHAGNITAVFLTILSASLTAGLIILTVQHAGLRLYVGWLFVAIYLTNPVVLRATLNASGIFILIFFLGLVFINLSTWQKNHYWLALVWIGLGTALAVLSQFSALFFLILPVLAALIIAYRKNPGNVYYAENALWIMLTPLLYVFLVRFFFGLAYEGDPFAFYQLESTLVESEAIRQAVSLPILPRLGFFLRELMIYLWLSNPLFLILSAVLLLISAVKRRLFPAVYLLILSLPLLLLYASRQTGFYDPRWIISNLLLFYSLQIAVISSRLLDRKRWIYLIPSVLLLAGWNGLQWVILL